MFKFEHGKGVIICLYVDDMLIFGIDFEEVDYASTIGWVYLLGGGALSLVSKKQTCIIDSTMAAEFVALPVASKEVEWPQNLLLEVPL